MPNNIKEVYEIFENIRTRLDDSYIISEFFNYFDVDQLAGFCESMIDSYDLDPVEMGVVNYIPEEDESNEEPSMSDSEIGSESSTDLLTLLSNIFEDII